MASNDTTRITVTIGRSKLDEVLRSTGEPKMSPAVNRAIDDYLRFVRAREFADFIRAGKLPYFSLTNEDLEATDLADAER
ncbi:MAG: hypothetical protein H0W36_05235 [Gemmatimonadetes bacterium]|nr:hypothetical protein [Gemmatimonadota bacterium]